MSPIKPTKKTLEKQKAPFAGLVFVQHDDTTGPSPRGGWHSCSTGLPVPVRLLSTDRRPVPARGLLLHLWAQEQAPAGGPLPLCRGWGDMLCGRPRQRPGQVGAAVATAGSIPRGLQGEGDVLDCRRKRRRRTQLQPARLKPGHGDRPAFGWLERMPRHVRLPWTSDGRRRKGQYGQRPCRGHPWSRGRQAAAAADKTGLAVRRPEAVWPEAVWPQQTHPLGCGSGRRKSKGRAWKRRPNPGRRQENSH